MKRIYAGIITLSLLMSTAIALPLGLQVNLEGGAILDSGGYGKQAYAQASLVKVYDSGFYAGVGMIHTNNLGTGRYPIDSPAFVNAGFDDTTLVLPGLAGLNNENNVMIHGGYERHLTGKWTATSDLMYIDDIAALVGSVGVTYPLSTDIDTMIEYIYSDADDKNFDAEGVGLSLRARF